MLEKKTLKRQRLTAKREAAALAAAAAAAVEAEAEAAAKAGAESDEESDVELPTSVLQAAARQKEEEEVCTHVDINDHVISPDHPTTRLDVKQRASLTARRLLN